MFSSACEAGDIQPLVFGSGLPGTARSGYMARPSAPRRALTASVRGNFDLKRSKGGLIKAFLIISMISAAFGPLLSSRALAAEIPYTVAIGSDEQLTGVVYLDDSSGDAESVKGAASGVVNGEYALDSGNTHTVMSSPALKLTVTFDLGSQRLSAHLDTCPTTQDNCNAGDLVILWEK